MKRDIIPGNGIAMIVASTWEASFFMDAAGIIEAVRERLLRYGSLPTPDFCRVNFVRYVHTYEYLRICIPVRHPMNMLPLRIHPCIHTLIHMIATTHPSSARAVCLVVHTLQSNCRLRVPFANDSHTPNALANERLLWRQKPTSGQCTALRVPGNSPVDAPRGQPARCAR
jgi:hypothetical protein